MDNRLKGNPVGALVHSIQAVRAVASSRSHLILCQIKRALMYWKSGRKEVPSGLAGYFSKTNWDDRVERVKGKDVLVKKVTRLLNLVSKLKEMQWTKIIDGAMALAKQRKVEPLDADVLVIESSDFEIEDGDEELGLLDGDADLDGDANLDGDTGMDYHDDGDDDFE
jgi:hypothetical protein